MGLGCVPYLPKVCLLTFSCNCILVYFFSLLTVKDDIFQL